MNPTNPSNPSNPTTPVIIDPTQDPRWDKFVENHPFGWIVHLSGWKQVLEKSFKHMKGHYLALIDTTTDDIKAALPLFEVRSWLLGNRLVSIPFATLSDPLISSSEDMKKLFESALNLSKKLRTLHIEIRSMTASPLIHDTRLGVSNVFKVQYLLLAKDPEELIMSFHPSSVRRRIKRSIKSNLTLRIAENESDISIFYNLNLMTRKRLNLPPQPYIYIKSLWEIFSPAGQVEILLAEKDGQVISGVMLFKYKNRVSAEFTVWDRRFQDLNPNHFLYWYAIKSAYNEGYKIFDLGRTSIYNSGLMDYKKRWGTKIADLPIFCYPENLRKKFSDREKSLSYKVVQNICDNLPESAFKHIGNFCYRHLG